MSRAKKPVTATSTDVLLRELTAYRDRLTRHLLITPRLHDRARLVVRELTTRKALP